MADLTTEEQDALWDARTNYESVKRFNSQTQDANTYECYCFASYLEGELYEVMLKSPDVEWDSNESTIESAVKAVLATKEKIEFNPSTVTV